MKVYKIDINNICIYKPVYVVADSYSEAEFFFKKVHSTLEIKSIELISKDVIVKK